MPLTSTCSALSFSPLAQLWMDAGLLVSSATACRRLPLLAASCCRAGASACRAVAMTVSPLPSRCFTSCVHNKVVCMGGGKMDMMVAGKEVRNRRARQRAVRRASGRQLKAASGRGAMHGGIRTASPMPREPPVTTATRPSAVTTSARRLVAARIRRDAAGGAAARERACIFEGDRRKESNNATHAGFGPLHQG